MGWKRLADTLDTDRCISDVMDDFDHDGVWVFNEGGSRRYITRNDLFK